MTMNLDLPDPGGLNIVGWLAEVKHGGTFLLDPKRQCLIKLSLQGSVMAFVGATVKGALSLSLEKMPKAEAGSEVSAFVGAQAQTGAKALVKWSQAPNLEFHGLANIALEGGLSAGAGGEARLKIGYEKGKFRFEMSASATWGLGAKGGFSWEVDAAEGWKLVGHLCNCVNFHFVAEISEAAHKAYTNYAFASVVADVLLNRVDVDWANARVGQFKEWLREITPKIREVKAVLFESSVQSAMLEKVPPQALGQALITVMLTREETDFTAIKYILYSTVRRNFDLKTNPTANHKLKWTLRYVSDVAIPIYDGPERESMKEEALRDGIRRIREFGLAVRSSGISRKQMPNEDFLEEFNEILRKFGVE